MELLALPRRWIVFIEPITIKFVPQPISFVCRVPVAFPRGNESTGEKIERNLDRHSSNLEPEALESSTGHFEDFVGHKAETTPDGGRTAPESRESGNPITPDNVCDNTAGGRANTC